MVVSKLATKYMFENFGAVRWNSRGGTPITTIVVHHAATTNFDIMPGVWKDREASAHYGIGPDGTIRAYVDEEKRAWHCGDGNSNSIGIECTNISGDPTWKVSEKTIDSLVQLIKEIQSRRGRLIIIGHRDVPGNATLCPGPFLYSRLQEIRDRANKGGATVTKVTNNRARHKLVSEYYKKDSESLQELRAYLKKENLKYTEKIAKDGRISVIVSSFSQNSSNKYKLEQWLGDRNLNYFVTHA